jgi:hypothetical protein
MYASICAYASLSVSYGPMWSCEATMQLGISMCTPKHGSATIGR